jgi:hypothetical protein
MGNNISDYTNDLIVIKQNPQTIEEGYEILKNSYV